eukprot:scaffold54935_cov62-Phaeocystis_antarctica.AAC.1
MISSKVCNPDYKILITQLLANNERTQQSNAGSPASRWRSGTRGGRRPSARRRDAGAGGDRAIEPEGLALDDQHGARYLRRGGDKCQRGSGLGVCRARRYAQRRVAQKRAAGLLLTSVGLARLQGGTAKGGQGEAPKACGRRRVEEGLCWRRRREP